VQVVAGGGQIQRQDVDGHVGSKEYPERGQHHRYRTESTPLAANAGQLVVAKQFTVYRANSQIDQGTKNEDCDVDLCDQVICSHLKVTKRSDGEDFEVFDVDMYDESYLGHLKVAYRS